MDKTFQGEFFLSAGDANAEGRLALTVLVNKIIDIATAHANLLGIGNPQMAQYNAGWVLSRLTIEMQKYPAVNSPYIIKTWIQDLNRHFSTRCFSIESHKGEVYGYSRSIWMVMDYANHTNFGTSHLNLPPEYISGENVPIPLQEKHIPILPENSENPGVKKFLKASKPAYHYEFQFCDLDYYRHVNTVRYVALLLNQFSLQDHDRSYIDRMELSFLHEASYAMQTSLYQAVDNEDPLLSSFQLSDDSDGKPLLFARIRRKINDWNKDGK